MANFVRHGPCDRCGSKDNKGIYDDGSEYCFGCRYYKPPDRLGTKKVENQASALTDVTNEIPPANKNWLRQYLSEDQIEEFFFYSPSMDRHVYVEYLSNEGDGVSYWEARKVSPGGQKVISSGRKPWRIWGKWKETGVVVIVEDIVSAIKLSDFVGVLCLHGAVIPNTTFMNLGTMAGIKHIIIWMDQDKLSSAHTYVRRFEAYGKKCSLIMTDQDPKAYSRAEILEILGDAV